MPGMLPPAVSLGIGSTGAESLGNWSVVASRGLSSVGAEVDKGAEGSAGVAFVVSAMAGWLRIWRFFSSMTASTVFRSDSWVGAETV